MKRQVLLTKGVRFAFVLAMTAGLFCVTFALVGLIETGDSSAPVAHAAGTINVDTYDDEYNTDPGGCSLREAIQAVNDGTDFGGCTNPGGTADTVQLIAGTYVLTIPYGSPWDQSVGSLEPQESMTIIGVGPEHTVISATNSFNDRIFYRYGSGTPQTLAIEGVTIRGGNISGSGGGLSIVMADPDSQFRLTNVVIRDNQASGGYGGGLHLPYGPQVVLDRVTIYNNQGSNGGGLYFGDQYYPGYYEPGNDRLIMNNVTIYSNTASSTGGGFYASGSGVGITATNVTIAGNVAATNGGNIYNDGTIVSLKNTIVANGTSNDCAGNPNAGITSLGHNLDSDGSCGLSGTEDITDTDPLLDSALRYNGGIMSTVALLDGSQAINNGSGCPNADQRGFPRLGPCDIGAYEYAAAELYLPLVLKRE